MSSRLRVSECDPLTLNNQVLLKSLKRPRIAALAQGLPAGEVTQEWSIKLPVVQLLNGGAGIREGAPGDSQELQGAGEELALAALADQQIGRVCQARLGRQRQWSRWPL